ncbi:MAG: hypothetical protein DME65_05355 [Verrucomicrobia bacterium]|nr:MAG: hypothetical protein DME65_05355 [Verrucomicrobiota bacterium]
MPVTSEQQKKERLWPEHELVRQIKCIHGEAEVLVDFDPRLDYGRASPKIKDCGELGWQIDTGRSLFILRGKLGSIRRDCQGLSGKIKLKAGETLGDLVREKLDLTIAWWRDWADQSNYKGRYQRQVMRSALVLKLLSYAPSGAIVAAPTTSLPERLGADSNWDYRFAWLRDAAFTVHALFGLGYKADAEAFVDWLLHATRLTRPKLRVVYDVFGERTPPERELRYLNGYANARPVRVGNSASEQVQLDIYGDVVEAVSRFVGENQKLDRDMQKFLRQCAQYVCEHWREPDNGIWEYRDKRRHYTHSRLMCWVALDRILKMQECGQLSGIDMTKCAAERAKIRQEIETRAWNPALAAYAQACGSDIIDASVLLMA